MDSRIRATLTHAIDVLYDEIGAMGDLVYRRILPGGRLPKQNGGTGTTQGAQPPLPTPASDGMTLHGDTDGTVYWDDDATGAGAAGDAVLGGDGEIPSLYLPSSQEGGTVPEAGRWVRQGTILDPTETYENTAVQEPSAIVVNGEIRLYYTAGWDDPALALATCPLTADPTVAGNWTKHGRVLGQGASGEAGEVAHHGVFLIDGTYYCYFARAAAASALYVSASADGLAWGAATVAIAANQVAWADWWVNPMAWKEGDAWKMLLEGRLGSGVWFIARATSTDGLAWTIQGSGPMTSLRVASGGSYGGPWLPTPQQRDGLYELWYHATPASGFLPTNIYRATSPDLITWTQLGAVLTHTGVAPEVDQVADACAVEIFGRSYLFHDAADNPSEALVIRVATIDATLAQVVDEAPRLDLPLSPDPSGTYTAATVTVDERGRVTAATSGTTGPTQEQVEDWVAGLVRVGPGVVATYDDAAGTLTFRTSEPYGVLFTGGGDVALRGDGSIATKAY